MCNMDCLNCIHPDCINDELPTEAEIKAQDEYDRDINTDELRMQAIDKGKIYIVLVALDTHSLPNVQKFVWKNTQRKVF